jgi:hypothetical protein
MVDPGLEIEALLKSKARELTEVVIPPFICRQHSEVARSGTPLRAHLPFMPRARCDVEFTPNYRLYPDLLGLVEKLYGAMHVAMIGHGYRRLPKGRRVGDNLFKLISPVEEAVLCMKMEVSEPRHFASKTDYTRPLILTRHGSRLKHKRPLNAFFLQATGPDAQSELP